ncbi:S-layer family protein [Nodularia harveyana UHCC-0300]|uniref:S-layer family protein n=1 Tax=Nodularia harveyana UHCC-0300 TaxID=2974287 RepID=A0ABU5U968_9CYAN|nr:S-layer family protein [Nodularia harveyana]MEA5580047.1 S-layer family protein [Nodularia harveyana UHCC-0300]
MNLTSVCLGLISGILAGGIIFPANAQVTSDGTTNTLVNQNGNNFNILNGIEKGNNLFHSFSNFSLPTGSSATFNLINTPNITTIFSRVTGGNISNIDGLIQTLNSNNSASLFLMNPNGIVFGENAKLNIGGSFVGTTANSIKFADGTEFSAVNPVEPPLLTMSAPVGLQMGSNAGTIQVQGTGHQLQQNGNSIPLDSSNNPTGLQVKTGNTLSLIGGVVNFSGGVVVANGGGHLEVGSVSSGQIGLNPTEQGWVGDYSSVSQFNDIHFAQQSLLDASGSNGSIQVQGRNISLTEGSVTLIQNLGTQPSGGISVNATDSIKLTGNTADGQLGSFIRISNSGTSQTGNITVSAAELSLQDGSRIENRIFSNADSSKIIVKVAGITEIDGFAPSNPRIQSAISTNTISSGNAGNLKVLTGSLRLLNSGIIVSATLASGKTGTIEINAKDLIEIVGNNPLTLAQSGVTSVTIGSGNSGNVFVDTSRLVIREGGFLGSSVLATGSAGNVTVNASESIDIQGRASGSIINSRIASNAEILDQISQIFFRLPPIPSGNSGSLTINTPSLNITDGGSVNTKNDGSGIAGDVHINTNSIFLDNQGSITASTASGNGGNINLNLQENLLMRGSSLISATAMGSGNGGNLSINAPLIVSLENSDIVANALEGSGGNIDITTEGLFGSEYRNELTPKSDITASSQFGVSGTVQINNIGIDPNSGLVKLPANITDPSQQIAAGCANQGSRFVATGRGGIPQNPNQDVRSDRTWSDVRNISAFQHKTSPVTAKIQETPAPLVQANSWRRNASGKIELVADKSIAQMLQLLTCAAVTKN